MSKLLDSTSAAKVLQYFHGSDIQRVFIPQRTLVKFTSDRGKVSSQDNVGMVLIRANNDEIAIDRGDAEFVLNDGILNRLHIAIELDRPQ